MKAPLRGSRVMMEELLWPPPPLLFGWSKPYESRPMAAFLADDADSAEDSDVVETVASPPPLLLLLLLLQSPLG